MRFDCFEEEILKSSPIPYIFGEFDEISIKNNLFIIKDISYTLESILNIDKKNLINEVNDIFSINENKDFIIKENRFRLYIEKINKNYELIPTHIVDSKYVIWIIDIDKEVKSQQEDKIRSEFFTNLSHELRTPLNLIFSTLQVLSLKINEVDSKEKQSINKYLNIANQNTYRLLKLVNNIIDSNKITSGYFDYNPQNYDIIYFIESICQSVVDFAKEKNIEVIFDTEIEEKVICFDLDKMERIILNILSNAIKFSKEHGEISIYIKEVKDMMEIRIKDNGIGIEPHKLNSIFDRFKQADNNTIRRGEGSGIGLYLVKSLVNMHGGSVDVNSEIGNGTEFIIQIPNLKSLENECDIIEKNLQSSYIEKIKVEFSDIYA